MNHHQAALQLSDERMNAEHTTILSASDPCGCQVGDKGFSAPGDLAV